MCLCLPFCDLYLQLFMFNKRLTQESKAILQWEEETLGLEVVPSIICGGGFVVRTNKSRHIPKHSMCAYHWGHFVVMPETETDFIFGSSFFGCQEHLVKLRAFMQPIVSEANQQLWTLNLICTHHRLLFLI